MKEKYNQAAIHDKSVGKFYLGAGGIFWFFVCLFVCLVGWFWLFVCLFVFFCSTCWPQEYLALSSTLVKSAGIY